MMFRIDIIIKSYYNYKVTISFYTKLFYYLLFHVNISVIKVKNLIDKLKNKFSIYHAPRSDRIPRKTSQNAFYQV